MTRRVIAAGLVMIVLATTGSACTEDDSAANGAARDAEDGPVTTGGTGAADGTTGPEGTAGSVVGRFAGEEWFLGTVPDEARAADAGADAIVVGMINQENSPAGSFPEVRAAAQAAVAFVNAELGGVAGRPIALLTCASDFAPETSQRCAQDLISRGALAFAGGIDIGSTGSIPVLEQNGVALVGGIPTNLTEMRSPVAFFFSGGGPGAIAGLTAYAVRELGARRIAIGYGEFESFELAATRYGADVAEALGAEAELVPFPVIGADFLPVMTRIAESEPDAIVMAAADTACVPIMTHRRDLGIDAPLLLVGACAAPEIVEQAEGLLDGVYFNSEGPFDQTIEGELFQTAIDVYATEPAGGAGTVSFRGMMNLWALLGEVVDESGSDALTPGAILDHVRSAVDHASFWGHPFSCDGTPLPDLAALCAPQQYIFEIGPGGEPAPVPDNFVDVTEFAELPAS